MSEFFNSQTAWSKFKTLAQQVMGTKDISDANLKKLMKDADANGDGLFSMNELKDAMFSYDEYMNLEEEFLDAFDAIAKEDGETSSISEDDIKSAINGVEEAEKASNGGNGGSTGGSGSAGGANGTQPQNENKEESISRSDIEGKDIDTLQNEKGSLLNDISSTRNEKMNALTDAKQKTSTSQKEYNNATQAFDDLISTKTETDEAAQQASNKVKELNTQKSDKNSEISKQEGVVSDANTLVSTISSSLSSLQEPPQYISETTTNSDGTTSTVQKENPAYQTYLAQKAELENQLTAAESDLTSQEKLLSSLEGELSNIEKSHKQAVDNYCKVKEQLGQLTPELASAQKAIQDSKNNYDKAQTEEKKVSLQYDKQINTLKGNLNTYNDIIKEKDLNVPKGYSVVNGQIIGSEGDEKHTLTPISEEELPEGSKVDENNIIRDTDGKEIGRILGAEGSSPQIYIKEPAPLDSQQINTCVDLLLNGHNLNDTQTTAEDVWTDINGNGLNLQDINSTDLAKIREIYNQKVELHNEHEKEQKLKTFDEMAESMLKESNPEAFNHVQGASERADIKKLQEQTFSEYIKDNGVDITNTSQVIIDKYLNDYVKEKTGSEAKYNLSDEKINEVVSSLVDGAKENGEEISPNELLQNFNFNAVSSNSVAKIIQEFNKKSETNFTDSLDSIEIGEKELSHITDSLVSSINSKDETLKNSSTEVLNELIDKSLRENDSSIVEAVIKSADKNLAQVKEFISNGDLINKIKTSNIENNLKANLNSNLEEINKRKIEPQKLEKFNTGNEMMAVAHRGFSSEAPENTLAAIELAKENGYNAVELDISWTKDGVPVLLHDATIGRTSNAQNNAKCSDMNYQDLLQYDFGIKAGDEFANTKIPTFSEALDCCADNKIEFFAELKDTKDFTYEKAQKLVEEVVKSGMQNNITWISFDKEALSMIDKAMDDADLNSKLGYLSRDSVNNNTIRTLNSLKDDNNEVFLDIKASNLTASGAKRLANAGYEYGVWTVNDERKIKELENLGCFSLTTDKLKQKDIRRL